MIQSKKGLSEIVTSILIILIAVAAVVVIWQVLLPLIKNPGEQSVSLADCTSNPITIADPQCSATAGNPKTVTVRVTKLGPKALATKATNDAVKISFTDQADGNPAINDDLATLVGTTIASVSGDYAGSTVVISGNYWLDGAGSACNIPEVVTVTCGA